MATDIKFILASIIFVATYGSLTYANLKRKGTPVWAILLAGAAAMVFSSVISVQSAYQSINLEVIVFLFSMFVIVTAMEISGILEWFTTWLLLKARKPEDVIYLIVFGIGLASAILMNDTLALMGTPIMLSLAKKMRIKPGPLLLTLAFSVTIGSVMTPMGNPQNLLVALVSGVPAPVVTFVSYLAIPTLVNLAITCLILKYSFKSEFSKARKNFDELIAFEAGLRNTLIKDRKLASLTVTVTALTVLGILLVNILEVVGLKSIFGISEVSLLFAVILLLISPRRRNIINSMDWSVLVMFAGLFVLMQAVSEAGIILQISQFLPGLNPADPKMSLPAVLVTSILLSQLLSNVPMVALYLPIMKSAGYGAKDAPIWAALAGGSTLAGNLTLLGAASNLIIVEESEAKGYRLSLVDFVKIGVPLAIVNTLILYVFLLPFV